MFYQILCLAICWVKQRHREKRGKTTPLWLQQLLDCYCTEICITLSRKEKLPCFFFFFFLNHDKMSPQPQYNHKPVQHDKSWYPLFCQHYIIHLKSIIIQQLSWSKNICELLKSSVVYSHWCQWIVLRPIDAWCSLGRDFCRLTNKFPHHLVKLLLLIIINYSIKSTLCPLCSWC